MRTSISDSLSRQLLLLVDVAESALAHAPLAADDGQAPWLGVLMRAPCCGVRVRNILLGMFGCGRQALAVTLCIQVPIKCPVGS